MNEVQKDAAHEKSVNRIVADFTAAALPLEHYMREGLPLTPAHRELIEATLMGVEAYLMLWKQKHNIPITQILFPSSPLSEGNK